MRRVAVLGLGMLVLTGCTAAAGAGGDTVVAAVAPVDGAEPHEVVQGTVTQVDATGDRVHVDVWIVWAPVLRAERRTVEVAIDPATRFVPTASRTRLRAGDQVQVSLSPGRPDLPHAAEVTLLDLD